MPENSIGLKLTTTCLNYEFVTFQIIERNGISMVEVVTPGLLKRLQDQKRPVGFPLSIVTDPTPTNIRREILYFIEVGCGRVCGARDGDLHCVLQQKAQSR